VISFQVFAAAEYNDVLLLLCGWGIIIGQMVGGVAGVVFFQKFYAPLLDEVESEKK
jgi:hypothetical protein